MDGHASSIDGSDSRWRHYNVFFLGLLDKIVQESGLSRSGFSGKKETSVGVFDQVKKGIIHRVKNKEKRVKRQGFENLSLTRIKKQKSRDKAKVKSNVNYLTRSGFCFKKLSQPE